MSTRNDRVVIFGGPSQGKSTLAEEYKAEGYAVYCGDPRSQVTRQLKGPAREDFTKFGTTYLPEGLDFAGDNGPSPWIIANWFSLRGPWVCEGHCMARALKRWADTHEPGDFPCDLVIVLDRAPHRPTTKGQDAMHAGVMTRWRKCENFYRPITEVLR